MPVAATAGAGSGRMRPDMRTMASNVHHLGFFFAVFGFEFALRGESERRREKREREKRKRRDR